jgi:hypothetical protein
MNVKQNLQNKRQEIAQQAQQGPTNYQLAIRPNESSWRQQQRLNVAGQKEGRVSDYKNLAKPKSAKSKTIWEKESADDRDFAFEAGNQLRADVIAYGSGPNSNYQAQSAPTGSGIWEADAEKKGGLAPSQERLKVAAGKLYDLSRKVEAANEIATSGNYAAGYVSGYGSGGGGGGGSSSNTAVRTLSRGPSIKKDSLEKFRFYKSPQQFQIMDDAPAVRDYRGRSIEEGGAADHLQSNTIALPPMQTQYGASPGGLVPPPPSASLPRSGLPSSPHSRAALMAKPTTTAGPRITTNSNQLPPTRLQSFASDKGFDENIYGDEGTQAAGSREAQIAMLPPNVFTGIPVVKLGSSEAQASRALAASGTMERQRINGWTVLTFFKPQTRDPALQVYMRHGQVDALRTFDASLVGPDFGVRLGDSLATVKERFGEPAFIIPEPTPGAGQNYVYPISQVAFLMARPSLNEAPQVMGLFIFNPK